MILAWWYAVLLASTWRDWFAIESQMQRQRFRVWTRGINWSRNEHWRIQKLVNKYINIYHNANEVSGINCQKLRKCRHQNTGNRRETLWRNLSLTIRPSGSRATSQVDLNRGVECERSPGAPVTWLTNHTPLHFNKGRRKTKVGAKTETTNKKEWSPNQNRVSFSISTSIFNQQETRQLWTPKSPPQEQGRMAAFPSFHPWYFQVVWSTSNLWLHLDVNIIAENKLLQWLMWSLWLLRVLPEQIPNTAGLKCKQYLFVSSDGVVEGLCHTWALIPHEQTGTSGVKAKRKGSEDEEKGRPHVRLGRCEWTTFWIVKYKGLAAADDTHHCLMRRFLAIPRRNHWSGLGTLLIYFFVLMNTLRQENRPKRQLRRLHSEVARGSQQRSIISAVWAKLFGNANVVYGSKRGQIGWETALFVF